MISCIVMFEGGPNIRMLSDYGATNFYIMRHLEGVVICELPTSEVDALSNEPEVLRVEVDETDKADNGPASEQHESKAIEFMEVKKFHEEGIKGAGVKVAVFDSGVQRHEDLRIAGGINAYDQTKSFTSNINSNHGTKVAGIVAARDNGKGILGVAPECELYVVKLDNNISNDVGARWSEQIIGIDWAIENEMDAINCSFSGTTDSKARKLAFEAAHNAGITIFCSSGNRQNGYDLKHDRIFYPANYPFIIKTANITRNKVRNDSSSVGKGLDFSIVGTSVLTTTINKNKSISDSYELGTGTSFASPAVMGMFALLKQKYPNESREKILQRMYVSCEELGDVRLYGAGIPRYTNSNYENIKINERR